MDAAGMSEPDRSWLLGRVNQALALAGDLMTFDDLVASARKGTVQIFASDTAFAATSLITYPRARQLDCFLAAGTLRGVLDLEPRLVDFARENDAATMITFGRAAWAPIAAPLGWRADAVRYVKRLGVN
jgi:hypothetical protein